MRDIVDISKFKSNNKESMAENEPFSMLNYIEWFRRFAWFNNPFVSADSKLLKNINKYDKKQLERLGFFYNELARIAKERNLFFKDEYEDYLFLESKINEINLAFKICRKQNAGIGIVYFVNVEPLNNKSINVDMLFNKNSLNDIISIQSYIKSHEKDDSENYSK